MILVICISCFFAKNNKNPKIRKVTYLAIIQFIVLNLMGLVFSAFGPEYPLPFFILMLILLPIDFFAVFPKKAGYIVIGVIILINLIVSVKRTGINSGYNMPQGLTLNKIDTAGKIIAEDSLTNQNFNVASLIDGGTRNYPLRYTVLINDKIAPKDVTDYPNNNHLYLLSNSDRTKIFESNVWEIQSLKPFVIGKEWNLNDNIYLCRLDRVLFK
jgi:hypothetical protein